MNQVKSKYRGTVKYQRVYSELIAAAEHRGTVTYQEIAQLMGLPLTGNYMQHEVGQVLGEIAEDEHDRRRRMLSAVAVGKTGKPGSGFFDLARQLGRLIGESKADEDGFWDEEKTHVYRTWQRPLTARRSTDLCHD